MTSFFFPRRTLDTEAYIKNHNKKTTLRDDFANIVRQQQLKISQKDKRLEEEFVQFQQHNQLHRQNISHKHQERLKTLESTIQSEQQQYQKERDEAVKKDEMIFTTNSLLQRINRSNGSLPIQEQKDICQKLENVSLYNSKYLSSVMRQEVQRTIDDLKDNIYQYDQQQQQELDVKSKALATDTITTKAAAATNATVKATGTTTLSNSANNSIDSEIFSYIISSYQHHNRIYESIPSIDDISTLTSSITPSDEDDLMGGMDDTLNNNQINEESIMNTFNEFVQLANTAATTNRKAASLQKIIHCAILTKNYLNQFFISSNNEHYQIAIKSLLLKIFTLIEHTFTSQVQGAGGESQGNEEKVLQLTAAYLFALFNALPTKQKKRCFVLVFQSVFYTRSYWAAPDLLSLVVNQIASSSSGRTQYFFQQKRLLVLYCLLLSYQATAEASIPIIATSAASLNLCTISDIWPWISRFIKQTLYIHCYHSSSGSGGNIYSLHVNECLQILYTFLLHTNYALRVTYQETYLTLLRQLKEILTPSQTTSVTSLYTDKTKDIIDMIEKNIFTKNFTTTDGVIHYDHNKFYHLQDGHVLRCLIESHAAKQLIDEISFLESDKQSMIMQTIKSLQLDRLRVIFNRLSATEDSQRLAMQALQEKILIANSDTNSGAILLKYTLYKVIMNILKDCQEEFFNEMDVQQPMRLVRLITTLSSVIPALVPLVKQQFLYACPLLIPVIYPEDVQPGDMKQLLGLRKKLVKSNGNGAVSEEFEELDQYYSRMAKILVVYSLLCAQPEQQAFHIADIWHWLAYSINVSSQLPQQKPPQYMVIAWEVVLRSISEQFMQHRLVGLPRMLQLFRMLEEKILVQVPDDWPKKLSLQEFLRRFISSQGKDVMTLFNK